MRPIYSRWICTYIFGIFCGLCCAKNSFAQIAASPSPAQYQTAADELKKLYLFSTNFETAPSSDMAGSPYVIGITGHAPTIWGSEFGYLLQAQRLSPAYQNALTFFGGDPSLIPAYLYMHRIYFDWSLDSHTDFKLGGTFNTQQKLFGFGFEYQKRIINFHLPIARWRLLTSLRLSGTYGYSSDYFWSYLGTASLLESLHMRTFEIFGAYNWHYGAISFQSIPGEFNFSNQIYNGFKSGDHNFEIGFKLPLDPRFCTLSVFGRFGVDQSILLQISFREPTRAAVGSESR